MTRRDERTGDVLGEIESGGRKRTYRLHLPGGAPPENPSPLIFVLHGASGNAWNAARVSKFSPYADLHGTIVCYPDGTGAEKYRLTWNAGYCCGYAAKNDVDDVLYILELIESLKAEYKIDRSRVYAAGISNGGMMALRLGVELSDKFAGVASVAGAMPPVELLPIEPVSAIFIHGTHDEYVPFCGGEGTKNRRAGLSHPSVASGISYWTKANRVFPKPNVETLGGVFRGEGTASVFDKPSGGEYPEIVIERFGRGSGGAEVAAVTLNGGLHAWPGGEPGWRGGDEPSRALDATAEIWEFFKTRRK